MKKFNPDEILHKALIEGWRYAYIPKKLRNKIKIEIENKKVYIKNKKF